MGTHQQLTTEQIEVLILIDNINEHIKENKIEISEETNIVRIIDEMQATKENCIDICKTLEYYGYIEDIGNIEYELTVDGKQYIRLFKEYLVAKAENVQFIHNSYSLINIGKLKVNLEACLGKIDISTGLSDFVDFMKDILKKKDK